MLEESFLITKYIFDKTFDKTMLIFDYHQLRKQELVPWHSAWK